MNPTRHNHLFEEIDGSKLRLDFLKSKVHKPKDIEQEYIYKAPRKLSNIEKYNLGQWFDREFPKVISA